MTVGELLGRATEYLTTKGVDSPRLDAEHLLGKALGLSRIELYMHHDRPLGDDERSVFRELVRRRGEREPLAYVLGEWGFRRLTLNVDRRALVPRPETEVVVERALALLAGTPEPAVLDVGTGTGAIAIAIADEHPGARVTAIDVSADALELARENAERSGVAVELEQCDLHEGFGADEIESLEPEVRDWEPRLATVGNTHTRRIAEHARTGLRPRGHLVLEVAGGRGADVAALLEELGYGEVMTTEDLAGRDRVVEGRRP